MASKPAEASSLPRGSAQERPRRRRPLVFYLQLHGKVLNAWRWAPRHRASSWYGVWDAAPLETELLIQADRLVGGSDAVLVIDDTAVPKKGTHSVGVAAQYASALGKTAKNCQTLVSLTLARGEVPVMVALRLFLPDSWVNDRRRLKRAGVPAEYRTSRTKPEIAPF